MWSKGGEQMAHLGSGTAQGSGPFCLLAVGFGDPLMALTFVLCP
jgi:hypothetical protein